MKRLTPQQMAAKWGTNTGAATGAYQQGIMNPKREPGPAAADQATLWFNKIQEAYQSKRWENAMRGMRTADWQQTTLKKAMPILAQRVQDAVPKYARFISAFMDWYKANVAPQLESMKRGNLEQNIQRSVLVIRAAAAVRGQFKHGRFAQQ